MSVTNYLAYYDTATFTTVKSFTVQSRGKEIKFLRASTLRCVHTGVFHRLAMDKNACDLAEVVRHEQGHVAFSRDANALVYARVNAP